MEKVNFINMIDGTQGEYEYLNQLENQYNTSLAERIVDALEKLKHTLNGYQVNRLEHSLQSATRAFRNKENEELVVAALVHDIGDELAPYSHSEMAAAILRPFVSEKTHWIIKHHGLFQMYYYTHHLGGDQHAREIYKDHPFYQAAVDFCSHYDQNCFDPDYDSLSLKFFKPMLTRIFSRTPKL